MNFFETNFVRIYFFAKTLLIINNKNNSCEKNKKNFFLEKLLSLSLPLRKKFFSQQRRVFHAFLYSININKSFTQGRLNEMIYYDEYYNFSEWIV